MNIKVMLPRITNHFQNAETDTASCFFHSQHNAVVLVKGNNIILSFLIVDKCSNI